MSHKTIIVTGATSGIGLGVCKALIEQGALVFGIGRNTENLAKLNDMKASGTLVIKSFDLLDIDGIEKLVDDFVNEYGKIDALVNCAGIEETVPLSMTKIDKIRKIFEINVFSGIEMLRVVSKKKIGNDGGSYVFLSSVMGNLGQSGKVGYCSTKSALLGVVKASALELAKRKIRVNAVLPGIVKTPLTDRLFESLSEDNVNQITAMHPLGIGNVEDVVPSILFLLSDQSKWLTGQSIVIDGGYSIQ